MGNGVSACFSAAQPPPRRLNPADSAALDDEIGHSFCYVRHSTPLSSDADLYSSSEYPSIYASSDSSSSSSAHLSSPGAADPSIPTKMTFATISGASISANLASAPSCVYPQKQRQRRSTVIPAAAAPIDAVEAKAAAFECSECFTSLPLQPVPVNWPRSIPVSSTTSITGDQRGFLSGPLERINYSGPFVDVAAASFSAPLPNYAVTRTPTVSGILTTVFGRVPVPRSISSAARHTQWTLAERRVGRTRSGSHHLPRPPPPPPSSSNSPVIVVDDQQRQLLQWAQCKAGEDRVHVVVSDKHGWLFVGIYDGFNGPDAPEFLMSHLYANIYKELEGLLFVDSPDPAAAAASMADHDDPDRAPPPEIRPPEAVSSSGAGSSAAGRPPAPATSRARRKCCAAAPLRGMSFPSSRHSRSVKDGRAGAVPTSNRPSGGGNKTSSGAVLEAMALALEATETAFLEMGEKRIKENPEMVLMGSCVLVMLMKGDDVYVMNVGDSRAILAQQRRPSPSPHRRRHSSSSMPEFDPIHRSIPNPPDDASSSGDLLPLESIVEEDPVEDPSHDHSLSSSSPQASSDYSSPLDAVQLSFDHSTSAAQEVERIKAEHPDDEMPIVNDRVKGTLKVTRAFGAGFLKKRRWNEAVLEMLRVEYVGEEPYLSCRPWLKHEKLKEERDQFLVLSSDGLYQYLNNHEVVAHVASFMERFPDGDPAQHLLEELLFRAAKKAGMNFHELLDIPQGDRRKYHDDVSVMVISLQGRIWKCSS